MPSIGSFFTSAQSHRDKRLDSWKEIAAFFERDERTVRRWEIERGMPVHRVPGNARGVVYAFTYELEEWLQRPQSQQEPLAAPDASGPVVGSALVQTWKPMRPLPTLLRRVTRRQTDLPRG